jgi:hypothetical protein
METVKQASGRSYRQFCGLARALDVVGDRWNLLIVRELLPGPMRYNELKTSLAESRPTSWPSDCGAWRETGSSNGGLEMRESSMP